MHTCPLKRSLVIAGDVTLQHHLSNPAPRPFPEPEHAQSLEIKENLGGAALLARLVSGFVGVQATTRASLPLKVWHEDIDAVDQGPLTGEYHLWMNVVDKSKRPLKAYDRFLGYRHPDA